jgi:N-methylhydantoinase B
VRTRAISEARRTAPTTRGDGDLAGGHPHHPLKLYDRGELRDDVLKMVVTNVRHPHDFMGDLRAMIGSARVGERRLLALVESYGAKTVIDAVDEILDGAERQARPA